MELIKSLFDEWFASRLGSSETQLDMSFLSLRDARWNTLLIMDVSSEESLPIGTSDHRGEEIEKLDCIRCKVAWIRK